MCCSISVRRIGPRNTFVAGDYATVCSPPSSVSLYKVRKAASSLQDDVSEVRELFVRGSIETVEQSYLAGGAPDAARFEK